MQRGYLDLEEIKKIPATDAEITELQLEPGDILLNEGGDRDKLGRGWIWEDQIPACIHQNKTSFYVHPISSPESGMLSGGISMAAATRCLTVSSSSSLLRKRDPPRAFPQ